jgi:hypothetical protein
LRSGRSASAAASLFERMTGAQEALREIAPILMIIAGAGGLKQVLIDSGVSAELGAQLSTHAGAAAAARLGRGDPDPRLPGLRHRGRRDGGRRGRAAGAKLGRATRT